MRCLNCGLKTRALKRCGHCRQRPDEETEFSQFIKTFPQKSRKILFKGITFKSGLNSCVPTDDIPLDLTSNPIKQSPNVSNIEHNYCFQSNVGPLPTTSSSVVSERLGPKMTSTVSRCRPLSSVQVPIEWMSFPIELSLNYIRFGTYITSCESIKLSPNGLLLNSIQRNAIENWFKFDINIPFDQITCLQYSSEPTLPLIAIKTNQLLTKSLQKCLNLEENSFNGLVFDIDSNGILLWNQSKR